MTGVESYTERACAGVLTQTPERSRPLKASIQNTDMNQDLNALANNVTTKANEVVQTQLREQQAEVGKFLILAECLPVPLRCWLPRIR